MHQFQQVPVFMPDIEPMFNATDIVIMTVLLIGIIVCTAGLAMQKLGYQFDFTQGQFVMQESSVILTQDDKMGRGWQMRRPNFNPPQQQNTLSAMQQENQQTGFVGDKLKTKQDKIYVHYFPHSHTDLGWVNTLDEYYYGVQIGHYNNKVKAIIGTSIDELEKFDYRTFTFAEIKFFQMWWEEQTEEKKASVRKLVQAG